MQRDLTIAGIVCVGVFAGVLWSSALPGTALAQVASASALDSDLVLIETEIAGLERRVGGLRADVSSGSLTRGSRIISERFTEARYAFLVEDYERCALIFYSLLENDDLRGDPRRGEAQWYLAECLFQDGNLKPSQDQFQRIVDSGAEHPFYKDSLLKLIELFGRTGDIDRFNEYYNRFVRSSMESSATALRIRYEMGKTLFQQGKYTDAQAIFAAFPRGSTYTPQARYFSAVILVVEGDAARQAGDTELAQSKFDQAAVRFREVLTLPRSTGEHGSVADLCHLALGRLEYDKGDIPGAISEYSQVQSDSDFYADTLYEMIWANIEAASQSGVSSDSEVPVVATDFERTRKYEEALRAIEIFALAFPDDARDSTLRLLAGHVRVRMDRFEDAVEKYEDASAHFRELKEVLDEIVASEVEPMVYFNQLVDDDFVAEADLTVPQAARRQARSDEQVEEAVRISGDLYRQQSAIEDADDVLDLLEEALFIEDSQGLIQTYRINRQKLSTAEAAGLLLRSRLVELELAWLEVNLRGSELSRLDSLREQLASASGATAGLSMQRQELLERQEVFVLQAQAVETRVYHVELAVKDLLGRLDAVEQYLVDARGRGDSSREEELAHRQEIDAERTRLDAIADALHELRKSLEPRVLTAGLGSETIQGEGAGRLDARQQLGRVEGRLASLRGSVEGGTEFSRRIDAARTRLLDMERIAGETRDRMDRAEAAEVGDIKDEVAFQRRTVRALDTEGTGIATSNEAVSGRIGEHAFVEVASFYEDMLTRADMGIVDVYWYRKETTSKDREGLAREKGRRLDALDEAFRTVLGAP